VLSPIQNALVRAGESRVRAPVRGFIAVWKDPWMTLSRDTYAHDLLACAGIANVFADATERYPRITLDEIAAHDPELILLPDEPYRFTTDHAADLSRGPLATTRAVRRGNVHVVDGTLPFWHGPRIACALDELVALASAGGRPTC
jgi:ABC-type Fe3+-hydroxamate transport system substrate-binding protein